MTRVDTIDRTLGRFHRRTQAAQDARKIGRILLETGAEATPPTTNRTYQEPADARALRGIPAIGRGVTGAIPGTSPHGTT